MPDDGVDQGDYLILCTSGASSLARGEPGGSPWYLPSVSFGLSAAIDALLY
jgi:hypothetical protein